MNTTLDLQALSPREFDEALSKLYAEFAKIIGKHARHMATINHYVQPRRGSGSKKLTEQEALDKARQEAESEETSLYRAEALRDALTALAQARKEAKGIQKQIDHYDGIFAKRGGWSRFFLVANPGGHIHSSTSCSTCRPSTVLGWLPEVSGKTEEEAVAEHGARLCSVCFPSAPVEWTNFWELEAERKQSERCSASGSFNWADDGRERRRYRTCGACGALVAATASGKVRAHKPGR